MTESRLRLWFRKEGPLRFLGHRDLARTFERWFRRAGLVLQFSQGFHPRAMLNFPSALAVGIVGERELMEVVLAQTPPLSELLDRLTETACPDLTIVEAEILPRHAPKPRLVSAQYAVAIPPDRLSAARDRLATFLRQDRCVVRREKNDPRARPSQVDVRGGVLSALIDPAGTLVLGLALGADGSVRPREILQALELDDLESRGAVLRRVQVTLQTSPIAEHTPRDDGNKTNS